MELVHVDREIIGPGHTIDTAKDWPYQAVMTGKVGGAYARLVLSSIVFERSVSGAQSRASSDLQSSGYDPDSFYIMVSRLDAREVAIISKIWKELTQ